MATCRLMRNPLYHKQYEHICAVLSDEEHAACRPVYLGLTMSGQSLSVAGAIPDSLPPRLLRSSAWFPVKAAMPRRRRQSSAAANFSNTFEMLSLLDPSMPTVSARSSSSWRNGRTILPMPRGPAAHLTLHGCGTSMGLWKMLASKQLSAERQPKCLAGRKGGVHDLASLRVSTFQVGAEINMACLRVDLAAASGLKSPNSFR